MDQEKTPFERLSTNFQQSKEAQKLFTKNVVEKFWKKIDNLIDVDETIYDIISDLEFGDYLEYYDDSIDDKDRLRDMVLQRLGYTGGAGYYD